MCGFPTLKPGGAVLAALVLQIAVTVRRLATTATTAQFLHLLDVNPAPSVPLSNYLNLVVPS